MSMILLIEPVIGVNSQDLIALPLIRPDFTVDPLELIQAINGATRATLTGVSS